MSHVSSDILDGYQSSPQRPSPFRLFKQLMRFTLPTRSGVQSNSIYLPQLAQAIARQQQFAQQCSVSERAARILCDFLVVSEFLTKSGQEYALTADTAMFLDRNSTAYIGTCTRFLLSDALRKHFLALPDAVRYGGSTDRVVVDPESHVWVDFARSMAPMMMMASQELAKLVVPDQTRPLKVLDIAAGHGLFGIALLQANAAAKVTAVDWKNVLEVARENAEKFGVADRYSTLPGSIFDVDIGSGYDLVIIQISFITSTCQRTKNCCVSYMPGLCLVAVLSPWNLCQMMTVSARRCPRHSH